jgi:NADP-dependent 3-hydroxy acid dehydrogenase YdfG
LPARGRTSRRRELLDALADELFEVEALPIVCDVTD